MDMLAIIAAFGGGVFGAAIGALNAFIMTGLLAIVGFILGLAGVGDLTGGLITFGGLLGPHVAFAGGVAAAAYAGNKGKGLASGTDIVTALNGLTDYTVLLVGGAFGIIGAITVYLLGGVLKIPADGPAMGVIVTAIITRFVFGKTGLTGKYTGSEPRTWFPKGKGLFQSITLSLALGIVVSCIGQQFINAGVTFEVLGGFYPVVCFGISAFSLIFVTAGLAAPATHHITLPAAIAFCKTGNIFVGIVVAVICALIGDVVGNTFNSHCDSHIDPPAITIFSMTLLLNIMFP